MIFATDPPNLRCQSEETSHNLLTPLPRVPMNKSDRLEAPSVGLKRKDSGHVAKPSIGLDIGTSAVRAVELRLGDRPTVTRLGQMDLPSGSVVEGEVMEPGDVAGALRRLWKESGIKGKDVRVGVPLSRAIIRTIEVADLPESELRSMIGLELADHVPLDPANTAYDILPLERVEYEEGVRRRVLLAAAPHDAIRPTLDAVRQAGLTVSAVEVAPLALSRVFAPAPIIDHSGVGRPSVDLVVSVGAGTMLTLVCTSGHLLFNRKATSPVGKQLTDRIQYQLAIAGEVAEMTKRRVITNDNRHLLASVNDLTETVLDEFVRDLEESISYFRTQPSARPIDRLVLAGGGSLLAGLDHHLAERLPYPVTFGDPLQAMTIEIPGVSREQLDEYEPFISTAVGYALGGSSRYPTLNLQPKVQRSAIPRHVMVLGGAGVVGVLAMGGLYMSARSDASSIRDDVERVRTENVAAMSQLEKLKNASPGEVSLSKGELRKMVARADERRVDWTATFAQLGALSAPLDVVIDGFSGEATAGSAPADAAAGASTTARVGTVSFAASAPSLDAISAWIKAVDADDRFFGVLTPSITDMSDLEASADGRYRFDAQVGLAISALLKPPEKADGGVDAGSANVEETTTTVVAG